MVSRRNFLKGMMVTPAIITVTAPATAEVAKKTAGSSKVREIESGLLLHGIDISLYDFSVQCWVQRDGVWKNLAQTTNNQDSNSLAMGFADYLDGVSIPSGELMRQYNGLAINLIPINAEKTEFRIDTIVPDGWKVDGIAIGLNRKVESKPMGQRYREYIDDENPSLNMSFKDLT